MSRSYSVEEVRDIEAFAQMQRFVQTTGRGVTVYMNGERAGVHIENIIDYQLCAGWSSRTDKSVGGYGATFAEAWAQFCEQWPEAGQS